MQLEKVPTTKPTPPASLQAQPGGGIPAVAEPALDTIGSLAQPRHQNSHIHLSPGWRLSHDPNQWILQRSKNSPHKAEKTGAAVRWVNVAYIATQKRILQRCIAENGCQPDTAGTTNLAALPDDFPTFIKETRNA
jgi:hypothetical protein